MNIIYRKKIVFVLIILFLFITFLPFINANEVKPNLVITRIFPYYHDVPVPLGIVCDIKNIGDTPVVGPIDVRLIVRKGIFGFTPVYNEINSETINLDPGENDYIHFGYIPDSIGFYIFRADINGWIVHRAFYIIIDPEDAMFGWWGFG